MWPPHFLMNFGNSSYSVTYRNICRDFVTNLSPNRDVQHYKFRTIKILTYQYLVPLVSLDLILSHDRIECLHFWVTLGLHIPAIASLNALIDMYQKTIHSCSLIGMSYESKKNAHL